MQLVKWAVGLGILAKLSLFSGGPGGGGGSGAGHHFSGGFMSLALHLLRGEESQTALTAYEQPLADPNVIQGTAASLLLGGVLLAATVWQRLQRKHS